MESELPNKAAEVALALLTKTYQWAREINPSQPLTAGVWGDVSGLDENPPIFQFMLANADADHLSQLLEARRNGARG